MSRFEGPRPLAAADDITVFDSGEPEIDSWLRTRALRAEASQTARTYVITDTSTGAVAGYCCLSPHSVNRGEVGGGWLARNAPDPVPVILLGRLGIDRRHQGQALGAALLKDALLKAIAAARVIGARALLVHALNTGVIAFYERYGFRQLPGAAQTLYLPLDRLR
ncbi:MAG: GNAT family N-acetyltransferase [Actinomycetia bacterium]|nr:GNAT family N-acetyltransferase [Actinomycetes bacterium]